MSSMARVNMKVLTQNEDFMQMQGPSGGNAADKTITPHEKAMLAAKSINVPSKGPKHGSLEKNEYDHKLMLCVKKSIKQSRSLVADNEE